MSKIDLSNVEAYLLDYAEGNLSSDDLAELVLFISHHPEIGIDLSELTHLPVLKSEKITLNPKSHLLKNENSIRERFDELCMLFYEKQISSSEKNELDYLITQFPTLEKEFIAFSKTYLQEDLSLNFQSKEGLKKQFHVDGSFDDLCVKEIESGLSLAENAQLVDIILKNPALQKERNAFQHTVLEKDEIQFPLKSALYKEEAGPKTILLWSARIAVAAGLLLIMGIFLFNQDTTKNEGLAFVPADTLSGIRVANAEVSPDTAINPVKYSNSEKRNSPIKLNPTNKSPLPITEPLRENSVAALNPKTALPIKKFELPSEYIALNPSEIWQNNESPVVDNQTGNEYLKPRQVIWQQITRVLKRNKIDIESPLAEVKKDGFAEIGYRSLERASRGSLVIERDSRESKSKITGIQFMGFGFSKSSQ